MTGFNFSQNNTYVFNYDGNVSVNQNSYSLPIINDSLYQFPYSSCKDNSNIDLMFGSDYTSESVLNGFNNDLSGDSFLNNLEEWFYSTLDSILNSQSSNSQQKPDVDQSSSNFNMFEEFMNLIMSLFSSIFSQIMQDYQAEESEDQSACQAEEQSVYQPEYNTGCNLVTPFYENNSNDFVITNGGVISTGGGDDYIGILPGSGDTYVDAGSGNDLIEVAVSDQQGNIYINGGEGFDTLNLYDYSNTNWDVSYVTTEGSEEQLAINIGDKHYIVGESVEAINIYGPNGEVNIVNVSDLSVASTETTQATPVVETTPATVVTPATATPTPVTAVATPAVETTPVVPVTPAPVC